MKTDTRSWNLARNWRIVLAILLVGTAGLTYWRYAHSPRWITFSAAERPRDCVFSPDGKRLAVVTKDRGAGGNFKWAIYDAQSFSKIKDLESPSASWLVDGRPSWSPDGARIVLGYDEGTASGGRNGVAASFSSNHAEFELWDGRSGRMIGHWPYASAGRSSQADVAFAQDGTKLLGEGYPAAIFDVSSGARVPAFNSAGSGIFNSRGDLFAGPAAGSDRFSISQVSNGQILWQPNIQGVYRKAWSQNGVFGLSDMATTPPLGRRIWLWDSTRRSTVQPPTTHQLDKFSLNDREPLVAYTELISPSSVSGSVSSRSNRVVLWNYRLGKELWRADLAGEAMAQGWSPDGKWLAIAAMQATQSQLSVFDPQGRRRTWNLPGMPTELRWSPDSQRLAIIQLAPLAKPGVEGIEIFDAGK